MDFPFSPDSCPDSCPDSLNLSRILVGVSDIRLVVAFVSPVIHTDLVTSSYSVAMAKSGHQVKLRGLRPWIHVYINGTIRSGIRTRFESLCDSLSGATR